MLSGENYTICIITFLLYMYVCMCVCACACVCVYIYIYMNLNGQNNKMNREYFLLRILKLHKNINFLITSVVL